MNKCGFKTTTIMMIIMTCASIVDKAVAIQCFSCDVTKDIVNLQNHNIITPICSQFDGSHNFIVDCPYSTMCTRIVSTMYLKNGFEKKTITLGCAKQKLSEYEFRNGKWTEVHSVQEVYQEGCNTSNDNFVGASRTYCHCRGNLCNSAHLNCFSTKLNILLLSILIIINLTHT